MVAAPSGADETRLKNVMAEAYRNLRIWVLASGKLLRDDRLCQLTWIKCKVSTDKVIQIEPEPELKKRKGKSPDFAGALMLTFVQPPPEPGVKWLYAPVLEFHHM